jgi:prolyl 4-hydroxylase
MMNMKKILLVVVCLCLVLLPRLDVVIANEDAEDTSATTNGACTAADYSGEDGTCLSSATATNEEKEEEGRGQICYPDGNCFGSIEEADQKYQNEKNVVKLEKPVNYGEPQQVAGPKWLQAMEVVQKTNEYMENVFQNDTTKSFRNDCKCRHELCAFWAAIGECENNPKYMLLHCAPVCQTCHEISFEHRCPFDKNAPTVWQKGDLQKMFERITTDQYYIDTFQPTILSRDPWVVMLENVATEEECERMIQLGADRGYERSKDVGKK